MIVDANDLIARAWFGEHELLRAETRHDPAALERLLAANFHEIGQSGRHWSRAETIAALTGDAGAASTERGGYAISERRADHLGDHAILLSYLLEFAGSRSWRSSLWVLREGELRLTFHQGTPTSHAGHRKFARPTP